MNVRIKLIFFLIVLSFLKVSYAQYPSPFAQKGIDFNILQSGANYISSDSFYNKIITKFDTADILKCIDKGEYSPLFRKGYIIIKIDSLLNISLVDISGNLMDYMKKPIANSFKNNNVRFRKDLLEDAKNKYIIQPLIVFSSDKNSGPFDSRPTRLVKSPYFDSSKVGIFFEAMTHMYLPDFFISTPVTQKGWLNAVMLPLVFVNYGKNQYYYGAWYKTLN